MAYDACIAEIQKAAGRDLTGDEKEAVADRVRSLLGRLKRAEKAGGDVEAEANRLIAEDMAMLKEQMLIAKRQTAINTRIKQTLYDRLSNVWGDNPVEGLKAMFTGSLADRVGSRDSLAVATDVGRRAKVATFVNDLERNDLVQLFRSGTLDLEVRQAAYALDVNDTAALKKLPAEAIDIARLASKHSEVLRQEKNAAGSWIGKRPGYLTQQSHDMHKIAKSAGLEIPRGDKRHYEAWKAQIHDLLDWDKTMEGLPVEKRDAALRSMFGQLSEGYHLQYQDPSPPGTGKGFANIAKRSSHDRKFVFKGPDAEHAYFSKFGVGDTLYDAMLHHMDVGGRDLAIMRKFGPNAQDNVTKVVSAQVRKLHNAERFEEAKKLQEAFDRTMKRSWFVISGQSGISDNHALSSASEMTLNIQRLADLGGMTLSSLNDINNSASLMNYYGDRTGGGFFEQTGRVAGELVKTLGRGPNEVEKKLAAEARIGLEDLHIPFSHTIAQDNPIPGFVSKHMQFAMKWMGAQWMQNRMRVSSILMTGARYGQNVEHALADLPAGMQAALRHYDISEKEWDIIRKGELRDYKNTPILNSGSVEDLPDTAFAALAPTGTASALKRAKQELVTKFGNLSADIADQSITAPSATTRAIMTSGLKRGHWLDEVLRHALLFKSYTIGYMRTHLGRELHGYHPDRIGSAAALARAISRPGEGAAAGLAGLVAGGLFWGHLSNALIDVSQNRQPELVPTDPESFKRIAGNAFRRSGAVGIYGDMLFANVQDYTSGAEFFWGAAAGPSGKRLASVWDIGHELYKGDPEKAGEKAFKLAWSTVPGRSLFYTRWATDYLIANNISEMLNPGYTARLQQNLTDQGRSYIISPTGGFD